MAKVIVKGTGEEVFRGQILECQAFFEKHEGAMIDKDGHFLVLSVENI